MFVVGELRPRLTLQSYREDGVSVSDLMMSSLKQNNPSVQIKMVFKNKYLRHQCSFPGCLLSHPCPRPLLGDPFLTLVKVAKLTLHIAAYVAKPQDTFSV